MATTNTTEATQLGEACRAAVQLTDALRRGLNAASRQPRMYLGRALAEGPALAASNSEVCRNPCAFKHNGYYVLVCMFADGSLLFRAAEQVEMREGGQGLVDSLEALGFRSYEKLLRALGRLAIYRSNGALCVAPCRRDGGPKAGIALIPVGSKEDLLEICLDASSACKKPTQRARGN